MANSRWRILPSPQTCPSMGTLYGGSVKMRSTRSSASRWSKLRRLRESPHSSRCRPSSHRSPRIVTAVAGSVSGGTAVSAVLGVGRGLARLIEHQVHFGERETRDLHTEIQIDESLQLN